VVRYHYHYIVPEFDRGRVQPGVTKPIDEFREAKALGSPKTVADRTADVPPLGKIRSARFDRSSCWTGCSRSTSRF